MKKIKIFGLVFVVSILSCIVFQSDLLADKAEVAQAKTETFLLYVGKLEQLVQRYPSYNNSDANHYSIDKKKAMVFQFIRNFKYNSSNWEKTGGPVDPSFVAFVKSEDAELYAYFEKIDTIPGDNIASSVVDVKHMAATISAYAYKTTTATPALGLGMSELQFDELAGWGGDVQQMIAENVYPELNVGTVEQYKTKALSIIGKGGAFDDADVKADVDAYNLFNLIQTASVYDALHDYYTILYKKRVTTFLGSESEQTFMARAKVYTNYKYATPIAFTRTWDLYASLPVLPVNLEVGVSQAVAAYFFDLRHRELEVDTYRVNLNGNFEPVRDFKVGQVIKKDVSVSNQGNTGADVWVRMNFVETLKKDGVQLVHGIRKPGIVSQIDTYIKWKFSEQTMLYDTWEVAGKPANTWVVDDDGWYYYTSPLPSNQTTNLLLETIQYNQSINGLLNYDFTINLESISADLCDIVIWTNDTDSGPAMSSRMQAYIESIR